MLVDKVGTIIQGFIIVLIYCMLQNKSSKLPYFVTLFRMIITLIKDSKLFIRSDQFQ